MRRLKILFVTSWYPTKEQPVIGTFVREHAKAVSLYDDVVVLHCMGTKPDINKLWTLDPENDRAIDNGIPTYRVWTKRSSVPKTSYLLYLWGVCCAIKKLVAQGFRPDIIHAHIYAAGVPSILFGKIFHIPVVVTEHSSAYSRNLLSDIDVLKASFAFRNAKKVFPVSYALEDAISKYGIKGKFTVVPNAIDSSLFHPENYRPRKDQIIRLLLVGLFDSSHNKGIPFLLFALSKLKESRTDWHLDLIGDGPPRNEYEEMAVKLGIYKYVTFHGMKKKPEIAEFMRNVDFYVLPSIHETFSVSTAEALMTGLPIIATRCGGPEELVTEQSGVIVPPKDSESLCKAISFMMDNLSLYSADIISKQAKERFSLERVGAEYNSQYLGVLDKNSLLISKAALKMSIPKANIFKP